MSVFFTCSTHELLKYSDYYLEIHRAIKRLGHTINRDWIEETIKEVKDTGTTNTQDALFQKVLSSILTADIVIIDATVRSMSVGYQISFALEKRKPTLVLQHVSSENRDQELFIKNEKSRLAVFKNYHDKSEIEGLIKEFITEESRPNTRFNLVLPRKQDKYIEWAAYTYGKSKTEIIHEALSQKMESDTLFNKSPNP